MRVLVTGASGFVGEHLCRHLIAVGDEVVRCPGPTATRGLDVTDGDAVFQRIRDEKPDGIVHLAAVSSVAWSHANPAETFRVNLLGTVNLLEAIRAVAPRARVLLVGSGEMYGRMMAGRRANEQDAMQPLSPYAASKCAAEGAGFQYAASYGLQVVCSRPFNHLGPGQAKQFVVPSFARQLVDVKLGKRPAILDVGDLTPVRDFLHVGDVIRGYRLLLEHGEPGQTYNLCSGEPVSIRSLLENLLLVAGLEVQIRVDPNRLRPTEIPWLVGDASRARALGWRPERTVGEALSEAFAELLAG